MPTDSSKADRAVLIVGDTLSNLDLRHNVPIPVPDAIIYVEPPDGAPTIYCGDMDVPLLREGLEGIVVRSFDEVRDPSPSPSWPTDWYGYLGGQAVLACKALGVASVATPARFPLTVAEALSTAGIDVASDEDLFVQRRRVKTEHELTGMRRASRAAERGWDAVRDVLRDGRPTTSEELRAVVRETVAADQDLVPYDIMITSHGGQAAVAHELGSGQIAAGESIIVDLMVRDRTVGTYADVTRTFCVGEPADELVSYFELCREALEAAVARVRPGALVDELNAAAADVFEGAGYPTLRQKQPGTLMDTGFFHPLGHGVGLEVHEPPVLAPGAQTRIVEGEVLCIEPALYRPDFGACRLEDMVLVTSDGFERLTEYEYSLAP